MKTFLTALAIYLLAFLPPTFAHDCLDAKTAFSIAADGTDETTAIVDALEASATQCVYFGAGTYAFNPTTLDTFQTVPQIETAGQRLTVFKNLSPTSRMFEFAKHSATDLKTVLLTFGDLTIDQNGSTGDAIKVGAYWTRLYRIWVKNQAGAGIAFNLDGITQGVLEDLQVTNSSNCMRLYNTYYARIDQFGCERTTGIGVEIISSVSPSITGLYLDNGSNDGSLTGVPGNEIMKISSSLAVDIRSLSGEFADGGTLTPPQFIKVENSTVSITGGRINHTTSNGSKYIFYTINSDFRLQQFTWEEAKFAMVLIGGNGNIVARDIVTTGTVSGSGTRYGILNDTTAQRVEIENWINKGTVASNAYISATNSYIRP